MPRRRSRSTSIVGVVLDGDIDEEPFAPIARSVESEATDLDWESTTDVRDPDVSLVLSSAPAGDSDTDPVE